MAFAETITTGLGGFGVKMMGGVIKGFLYFLGAALMGGSAWWIIRQKKFNHVVHIFEKDSMGKIIELPTTKGGEFIDRSTKNRLFKLKGHKIGLSPDELPFIQNSKGQKVVYLLRQGLRNFQYLGIPQVSTNPGLEFNVQDEDIAWGYNEFEKMKLPNKNDMLMKVLPVIGIIMLGMTVIIIIYLIMDKGAVMVDAARAFEAASKELAKASLGTTVIE